MKWLGSVAMAALVIGACSQKSDGCTADDDIAGRTEVRGRLGLSRAAQRTAPAPSIEKIPAGDYTLDPAHSTFMFKVSHLGFSNFTLGSIPSRPT